MVEGIGLSCFTFVVFTDVDVGVSSLETSISGWAGNRSRSDEVTCQSPIRGCEESGVLFLPVSRERISAFSGPSCWLWAMNAALYASDSMDYPAPLKDPKEGTHQ